MSLGLGLVLGLGVSLGLDLGLGLCVGLDLSLGLGLVLGFDLSLEFILPNFGRMGSKTYLYFREFLFFSDHILALLIILFISLRSR